MARRAVTQENLARVDAKLKRVRDRITHAAREEVERSAVSVESLARTLAPVGETGDLARSIRWRSAVTISGEGAVFGAIIGTPIEYAPFVEFGTRFQPARPFLFPAFEHERPIFEATLNQRISNEIRRVRRFI